MSRSGRLLLTVLGGVVVFAVFAVAGFAVSGWMSDDEEAELAEPEMATIYTPQPAWEDTSEQFDYLGEELEQTREALESEPDPEGRDPGVLEDIGGLTTRVVPESTDVAATSAGATSTTLDDPVVADPETDRLPRELFDDIPFLFEHLDLTDVQIADPVGPMLIDLCAGPERLPDPVSGCPFGSGGTIVLDDEVDPSIQASVAISHSRCDSEEESVLPLQVIVGRPGTLNLTIWAGSIDSEPPADAFFGSFTVPAGVAASLTSALDAGEPELEIFCIEVPAISGRLIAEHFFVSAYPPDGGARGPSFRDELTNQSGRPPMGLVANGVATLNVRTFLASDEDVWVKAVRFAHDLDPAGHCHTGGVASRRGAGPQPPREVVAEARTTLSLQVDTGPTWPYEPQYSTLEVSALSLQPGLEYVICTYIVDEFEDIVESSATLVYTPSMRGIDVRLSQIGGTGAEPTPAIEGFIVQIRGCGAYRMTFPGSTTVRQLDDQCRIQGLSGVVTNGGFSIDIVTEILDDDDVVTHAWIPVSRDDLRCHPSCQDGATVATSILVDGPDLTRSGRTHESVARLDVEVAFADHGRDTVARWYFGEPVDYADENPEHPPHAFLSVTDEVHVDAGGATGIATLSLAADRPVSVTISVPPDYPMCATDQIEPSIDVPVSVMSTSPSIQLVGLCVAEFYSVGIEIVDADGLASSWRSQVQVSSAGLIGIHAELEVPPFPVNDQQFIVDYRRQLAVRSSWGTVAERHTPSLIYGSSPVPWGQGWSPGPFRVCSIFEEPRSASPGSLHWNGTTPLRSAYDVSLDIRVWRYQSATGLGPCQPSRNNPDAPLNQWLEGYIRFAATELSLGDLLEGVELQSETPFGPATLHLRAELR